MGEARSGQGLTSERHSLLYVVESPCMMLLRDERGREEEGLRRPIKQKRKGVSISAEWA